MKKILKELREQDEQTKEQTAYMIAGTIALIIIAIWIIF